MVFQLQYIVMSWTALLAGPAGLARVPAPFALLPAASAVASLEKKNALNLMHMGKQGAQ
jgi:hypothetical protein